MTRPSAWLLSAYRSDSHAYWADWLCERIDAFDWTRLELPGRHFRWRIRGNPLSWLDALPAGTPGLIVATSMVDLATLKGLHPRLSPVPCVYYFHENQFAYPVGERQVRSIEPQMVQLYGALAAERCLFNSRYNLDSFLAGIDELVQQLPDQVPREVSAGIADKSSVLPVPLSPVAGETDKSPLVLWNHRWEYDKAPQVFAEAMIELAQRGVEFELALLGARPSQTPPALQRLRNAMPQRIRYDAKVDAEQYRLILARAKVVVSTAIHEFQGLSVMQAVSAGAIPLVPDDLCYREQYPAHLRCPPGDAVQLADRLQQLWCDTSIAVPDVSSWSGERLAPEWVSQLDEVRAAGLQRQR